MVTPFRILLVGCGNMGGHHYRAIQENPRFELVGVIEPNPSLSFKVPRFDTLDLVKEINYDCAVVATPTPSHYEVIRKLLESGKHVLAEKPVASQLWEVEELTELAKVKNLQLAVGHIERSNPAVKLLGKIIELQVLGELIHIQCHRAGGMPGRLAPGNNVILDLAIHEFDTLESLFGPWKVRSSFTQSQNSFNVADLAGIGLIASSGLTASVHVNWLSPYRLRTLSVIGSKGVCDIDYVRQRCVISGSDLGSSWQKIAEPATVTDLDGKNEQITFTPSHEQPISGQLEQFAQLLTGNSHSLCMGTEILAVQKLAEISQVMALPLGASLSGKAEVVASP